MPPGDVLQRPIARRGRAGAGAPPPTTRGAPPGRRSPGCRPRHCIDVATGADGAQLAVWQQSGAERRPDRPRLRAGAAATGTASTTVGRGAATGSATPFAALTTFGLPVVAVELERPRRRGVPHGAVESRPASGAAASTWQPPAAAADGRRLPRRPRASTATATRVTACDDPQRRPTRPASTAPGRASARSRCRPAARGAVAAVLGGRRRQLVGRRPSISWLFGDGGARRARSVSHAYARRQAASRPPRPPPTRSAMRTAARPATGRSVRRPGRTPDPCGTGRHATRTGSRTPATRTTAPARPMAFKTVNATVVSGEVFVKLPAGAARARAAARKAPEGLHAAAGRRDDPGRLDARHRARAASSCAAPSDTAQAVQSGQFFRGRFVIRQVRKPRGKARSARRS